MLIVWDFVSGASCNGGILCTLCVFLNKSFRTYVGFEALWRKRKERNLSVFYLSVKNTELLQK